ncbi:hypothetical protein P7D43_00955 [Enterococcus avium]|uniref:DUF2479 domain-containing protein n=1 Tax=Enterococcus avium TaxID=33945 RepID=A0AAW8RM84_ENTAV|nr:hypothetical protein [Enterococcus avium]MDT2400925.1 hypothetical protein [Enterococcus avium]
MNLEINGLPIIEVTDFFITDYDLIAFDAKIDPIVLKLSFLPFYGNHITDENLFEFKFDGKTYLGRFGKLVYDKRGNVRFYLTTATIKNESSLGKILYSNDVTMINVVKQTVAQEKKINKLIDILKEKNILSDQEINTFEDYLSPTPDGIDINREVRDLKEYLSETSNTIEDIKNED